MAIAAMALPKQARLLRHATWTLLGLYMLQVMIGALSIWTDFSGAARVAHLSAGSAIWTLMVLIVVAGRYRAATPTDNASAPHPGRQATGMYA